MKMNSIDIELAVTEYFGVRRNIIVPNVWWGLGLNHECDLLVLTKANCAYEVEIKTSKSDLIKDKKKPHGHFSMIISGLYFAIPSYLEPYIEHIPDKAGILVCDYLKKYGFTEVDGRYTVKKLRTPKIDKVRFSDSQRLKLAELGCMRIFDLKKCANYHAKQYKLLLKKYYELEIRKS